MRVLAPMLRTAAVRAFIAGCAVSVLAAVGTAEWFRMEKLQRLDREATSLESGLAARMAGYVAVLRSAAGFFGTEGWVNRAQFRRYFAPVEVLQTYPGVQGIGVSVRLLPDQLDSFVTLVRREGWPGFRVWPEGRRDEYNSILHLEPEDQRNLAAIGYDMHTEATRRAAMDHARDTGQPALTGRVVLVQEIDEAKQAGFLIYFPIYLAGERPAEEQSRRQQLIGHAYAAFRAGDFMAELLKADARRSFELSVYDGSQVEAETLFFSTLADRDGSSHSPVRRSRTVRILDRPWTFIFSDATPPPISPWAVGGLGLLVSATAALLLKRVEHARSRAEVSEAATRERESELALLIDTVPALIAYIDRGGVYRHLNRRYAELLGAEGTIVGRHLADVLGAENHAHQQPYFEQALRGHTASFERWYVLNRQGARYLGTVFVPHRNEAGGVNGIYALVADLTAHKRAEESARFVADCGKLLIASMEFESTTRGIVHLAVPRIADVAVLFRVEDGALIANASAHANGALEQQLAIFLGSVRIPITAANNAAAAARTGMVVVAPELLPADLNRAASNEEQRAMLKVLDLRSALHVPVVVRNRVWAVYSFGTSNQSGRSFSDEHRQLAEEVSVRVRLAVENALLYREAQQEIEDRRKAERAAREAEQRFRVLVESVRDYAIMALDAEGRIASWNEGAERILGFAAAEVLGSDSDRFFLDSDRASGAARAHREAARTRGAATEERWLVRRDATQFWASSHTVALVDDEGALSGYAWILRDLTDRKRMEEDLERRVEARTMELNEAVHELEAFSYSVSHDLRAPLRTIRGFTDMALDEAGPRLNEDERGYLERVRRAAARLDRLIADLLAYTRVSKTRVELRPVSLQSLVTDLQREHPEFQLPRADVQIVGTLDPVIGNEAYLTQCLTNLLGNAVKFVREGERAKVRLWSERRDGVVRLHVRDHGIGIPGDQVHKAFEIFERLHADSSYEGTGVGLAIVRRAVQRMHGKVGLESKVGEGTTFWVELRAAGEETAAVSAA